jgi:hypothetical protein
MAGLNKTKTKVAATKLAEELTVNEEGAPAYKLTAKNRLIEQVLGAFWNEKNFYGKDVKKSVLADIQTVAKTDPKFILQLAAFARNEIYLRTAPQVLLVEAANIEACKPFVREYTPKIVKRADELSEVVAYQIEKNGGHKGFPNSLKNGLADAFKNFDEYQLNKYDSSKAEVSLGDVVKLVHPTFEGNEEYRKALYNYLTKDEVSESLTKIYALKQLLALDSIDDPRAAELIKASSVTWETLISKFGSTKETWTLVAPNMGYMALLRNLRNFEEKGVDLDPILERIANPEQVKRSKQLPFRFYSAFKNVKNQKVKRAIAQAFEASISNVTLPGKTAILVDFSGSMQSRLSDKSDIQYNEVGAVLGAIAVKKAEESIFIPFATNVKELELNPDDTMMTNINTALSIQNNLGGGTEAYKAFQHLGDRQVDRIILISDMQCYNSSGSGRGYWGGSSQVRDVWNDYVKKYPNAYLYSLDVAAYGTSQTASTDKNAVAINGWSDKILDFINLNEKRGVMEAKIKEY